MNSHYIKRVCKDIPNIGLNSSFLCFWILFRDCCLTSGPGADGRIMSQHLNKSLANNDEYYIYAQQASCSIEITLPPNLAVYFSGLQDGLHFGYSWSLQIHQAKALVSPSESSSISSLTCTRNQDESRWIKLDQTRKDALHLRMWRYVESTVSTHSCKLCQLRPIPSASTLCLSRFVTPMLSPFLGRVNNTIPRSIQCRDGERTNTNWWLLRCLYKFLIAHCSLRWSWSKMIEGYQRHWQDLTSTQVSWPTSSFAQRLASLLSNRLWDYRIPHSLQVDLKWTLRTEARECQHAMRHTEATCVLIWAHPLARLYVYNYIYIYIYINIYI